MAVVIFSLKKLILFLSYFTFRFFKALFIDGFVIHRNIGFLGQKVLKIICVQVLFLLIHY